MVMLYIQEIILFLKGNRKFDLSTLSTELSTEKDEKTTIISDFIENREKILWRKKLSTCGDPFKGLLNILTFFKNSLTKEKEKSRSENKKKPEYPA